MFKKILISIGAVAIVAGAAFGALYFITQSQRTSDGDTNKESNTIILDHSKDYGACDMLDSSSIKTALGDVAVNLQKPENMGIVGNEAVGSGVEDLVSDSQICVYPFEPGGTLENGFNSGNALIVEQIVFSNESGPKSLIKQIQSAGLATAVEGIGDAAFYSANDASQGPGAIYSFKLEVFIDKKSTGYTIYQPAESASLTAESAKVALESLARQAKTSN